MDRFDLRIDVPPVALSDLASVAPGEASAAVAARVAHARAVQRARFADREDIALNADAEGDLLQDVAAPTSAAAALLADIAQKFRLSARAYHRVLRVARTIADLEDSIPVEKRHVAEAAGYRLSL
jgi:magnesium chelatase family protein